MSTVEDALAANIRAERARRRLRQDDVAAALGCARSGVADMESGRRRITLNDVTVICRTLNVSLAELLRGADPDDLRALGLV